MLLLFLTARLVKVSDENNPLLSAGACQAIGEIGRNCSLPLPPGEQGSSDGEITKLTVVQNLLAIIKSGKENAKVTSPFFFKLFPIQQQTIAGFPENILLNGW